MQNPRTNGVSAGTRPPTPVSPGPGVGSPNLKLWLAFLCAYGLLLLAAASGAAEGYTLVLEDGRRIDITGYEETGDWVYYYRYDARIGVPRKKIKAIVAHTPRERTVPLDDEIMGRIARAHGRHFRLEDFGREAYVAVEMAPIMSPEERRAYLRKLLQLKQMAIFAIDDRRQAAERQGDVVERGQLEAKLIRALVEWVRGREALARMARSQAAAEGPMGDHPLPPEGGVETLTGGGADMPAESGTTPTALEELHDRQETLRLRAKKHAQVNPRTGGFHARRQAEEELRIVGLQIRYFEHLSAALAAGSNAARRVNAAPAVSDE